MGGAGNTEKAAKRQNVPVYLLLPCFFAHERFRFRAQEIQ